MVLVIGLLCGEAMVVPFLVASIFGSQSGGGGDCDARSSGEHIRRVTSSVAKAAILRRGVGSARSSSGCTIGSSRSASHIRASRHHSAIQFAFAGRCDEAAADGEELSPRVVEVELVIRDVLRKERGVGGGPALGREEWVAGDEVGDLSL